MKISELADWMTRGGDARIVLDPQSGLNRYHSAPYPRDVLAFASSTANDLSADAMAFLENEFASGAAKLESGEDYAAYLDVLRSRVSAAYRLPTGTDIFFAPSGTDLEYVALLAVAGRKPNGIANLLLGADEVGSGCIHSAAGRYFANETALVANVKPGQDIKGLPPIEMGDFPVRNPEGEAFDSESLTGQMETAIATRLRLAAIRWCMLSMAPRPGWSCRISTISIACDPSSETMWHLSLMPARRGSPRRRSTIIWRAGSLCSSPDQNSWAARRSAVLHCCLPGWLLQPPHSRQAWRAYSVGPKFRSAGLVPMPCPTAAMLALRCVFPHHFSNWSVSSNSASNASRVSFLPSTKLQVGWPISARAQGGGGPRRGRGGRAGTSNRDANASDARPVP